MIIYKATNTITGKSYIGQTVNTLKKRMSNHKTNSRRTKKYKSHFNNSILKYGWDNFEWEVLYECSSFDELNEKEMYYIEELNTLAPKGYNLKTGGVGCRHSEETKRKIGMKHKGKIISQEQREKISNALKGKKKTEEHKRRISEGQKGNKRPYQVGDANPACRPDVRKKISEANKNRKRSDMEKYIYELIDPDGKTIVITNLKRFAKENNLDPTSMRRLVKGYIKKGIHKGWKGRIVDEIDR